MKGHHKKEVTQKNVQWSVGSITYIFPNFNGSTVEALEWINNFISLFIMDVITSWD